MYSKVYGRKDDGFEKLEALKKIVKSYEDAGLEAPEDIVDNIENFEDTEIEIPFTREDEDMKEVWKVDIEKMHKQGIKYIYFENCY